MQKLLLLLLLSSLSILAACGEQERSKHQIKKITETSFGETSTYEYSYDDQGHLLKIENKRNDESFRFTEFEWNDEGHLSQSSHSIIFQNRPQILDELKYKYKKGKIVSVENHKLKEVSETAEGNYIYKGRGIDEKNFENSYDEGRLEYYLNSRKVEEKIDFESLEDPKNSYISLQSGGESEKCIIDYAKSGLINQINCRSEGTSSADIQFPQNNETEDIKEENSVSSQRDLYLGFNSDDNLEEFKEIYSFSHDDSNLNSRKKSVLEYNRNGQLSQITDGYFGEGNEDSVQRKYTFTYDEQGRLNQAKSSGFFSMEIEYNDDAEVTGQPLRIPFLDELEVLKYFDLEGKVFLKGTDRLAL